MTITEPCKPTTEGECPATHSDVQALRQADLQTVLDAWHAATERLQLTHQALRAEVRRLSDELEAKNRELARKNRLADLGQMAGHVAHEVRNSLVPLTLYVSLLRRKLNDDPTIREVVDQIESGFSALETTVNDLLDFTAHRDPSWSRFELRSLLEETCESIAPQADAQRIELRLDVPRGTLLSADREMLRRALLNLILNALDAMPQGGELVITSWAGPHGLELEVADSGPGIEPEQLRQVFEPFYSTKSGGTGLGLSVVDRVAAAHGGRVTAANCPEGGAAITIILPRRAMEAAA